MPELAQRVEDRLALEHAHRLPVDLELDHALRQRQRLTAHFAPPKTPRRPIADSIALDAVCPRPQIEASRMHWPISATSASSAPVAAARAARDEARERLLLAHRADAARHALPARLVAEERRDALQEARQVDAVVEHQHDARAERRLGLARALERERQVELVGPQEAARRAAHEHGLQLAPAGHAARQREQLASASCRTGTS